MLLAPLLWSIQARGAADYSGRFNLGIYTAKEQHVEPSADVYTNDQQRILGTFYFDAAKLGPFHNEFTLDVRDKYDFFGQVEAERPRLVAANEPQLRQLAIKYPFENDSIYWAVGRVPIADAEVLGNDGGVFAVKVVPKVAVGVFAGLHPEQRDGRTVQLAKEDRQGGLYAVYQDRSRSWDKNTYAATSVVVRQPAPVEPTEDESATATATATAADEAQPDETPPPPNRAFWYTNVVHQPSASSRFTYISHVDVQPEVHVRNLWASYFQQVTPRVSGTVSALRLDLTEYERERDLRDTLPTSIFTQGRFDARYKFSRLFLVDLYGSHGVRALDGKSRSEANLKLVSTSLGGGRVSAFAGGGIRKNFESHDQIARTGVTLYTSKLEIGLTGQYIVEAHDDGTVLHPMIADVSFGGLIGDSLLASASVEYAKDERVTITSALVTLGLRFGNRQAQPARDRAPRLERL